MGCRGELRGDDYHLPVMVDEVVEFLKLRPGSAVADVTLGGGGHSEAILKATSPDGVLIGIDRDPEAIAAAMKKLGGYGNRVRFVEGRMGDVSDHLERFGMGAVDGILADLGVSSHQVDTPGRGFGFKNEGPLDMRMNQGFGKSAIEILSRMEEVEICDVLKKFGEERYARRIARAISGNAKIRTTSELADAVRGAVPASARGSRIHPATRVFQAIRIMVNDEMGELDRFLRAAPGLLSPGGRLVVISYHSLEDRRVKRSFRALSGGYEFSLPRRRAMTPSEGEISRNARSRSAKLRVLERAA